MSTLCLTNKRLDMRYTQTEPTYEIILILRSFCSEIGFCREHFASEWTKFIWYSVAGKGIREESEQDNTNACFKRLILKVHLSARRAERRTN